MINFFKNLVTELPKSPLPAGYATEGDEFTFFVSGPKPLECDKYIIDGEAIVLSTGGNAAVHYGKGKFSYSTDCWALQPVEKDIEGKYLYYFLSSQIDRINALGFEGSGLKHLRKDFIRNYEVPDLSKPEQSKIAEVLSKVDQAIEQTESLIAKQQRIKTGLMHNLLTRGIDEHGNLRSEETHEFKDSPLGRIPVEWEVKPLNDCVSIVKGQKDPRKYPYREWVLIAPDHIESKTGRLLETKTAFEQGAISGKYEFQNGDVVYSKIRPYLRKAVKVKFSGLCSADMYPLRPKESLTSDYLFLIILSEPFSLYAESVSERSGFPKINRSELSEFRMTIPKINEQYRVSDVLNGHAQHLGRLNKSLTKLRYLKTALMQDLLTGKMRVTPLMKNMEVID